MAENKPEAPKNAVASPRNSSPLEVLAARRRVAEETGVLTPKMQRQFDRMAAKLQKGSK